MMSMTTLTVNLLELVQRCLGCLGECQVSASELVDDNVQAELQASTVLHHQ